MSDKELTKEGIALQLTLKSLDLLDGFSDIQQSKTLPYEIYNSILKNLYEEPYVV